MLFLHRPRRDLLGVVPAQKLAIASTRHPARSRQVAVVDMSSALRLLCRVDPEQNFDHLTPISTVGIGVEQAHVELNVAAVIVCEFVPRGSGVVERPDHDLHFPNMRNLKHDPCRCHLSGGGDQ